MSILLYVVSALLVGSVLLYFYTAIVRWRPQKTGLLLSAAALPLFILYYDDRAPFYHIHLRAALAPIAHSTSGTTQFASNVAPAVTITAIYAIRIVVYQRMAARRALADASNPIANFVAGTAAAVLIVGIVDSMYSWGWIGAASLGIGLALVYLLVIGVLPVALSLVAATTKLVFALFKQKTLAIVLAVTKAVQWLAMLSRRLLPNLRGLVKKVEDKAIEIEQKTAEHEEAGTRALEDAYLRNVSDGDY